MTGYNERLDEALASHGAEEGEFTESLKQAITSLIKELVEEAKPYGKRQFRELIEDAWYEAPTAAAGFGRIEAIHNQFEQNILKALEEIS